MSANLSLRGSLEVKGGSCVVDCCGGTGLADRYVQAISFPDCGSRVFEAVVGTPEALAVSTSGSVGQAFVDLAILEQLSAIEFLLLESSDVVILRVGAGEAELLGSGGTFPSGFSGGETLTLTIDGVAVSVAFLVGDQTAAQCAARINGACAVAGLATPRCSVDSSGQLLITSVLTGAQGFVAITGGTGAAALGFAGTPSAEGTGADLRINGTFMATFDRYPNAPARVQISGTANVTLTAAGRSAS